jgi:predicted NBD/HSP70 family sugar kinase
VPTHPGPAATDEVRRRNTALVMRLLRDHGALSRADLARRSGLAKATVGTIVAQLQRVGAVSEGTTAASGRGRPSTPVALDGRAMAGLGIEVNVDYVAVTAVDLAGRELSFEKRPVAGAAVALGDVVALVGDAVAGLVAAGTEPLGVTVAVPGLIDRARGVVVHAPNLGWRDVPLADALVDGLDHRVPVAVDNDANCAARAEGQHGAAAGVDDFVYLTGTVGLGAGIVCGGTVLRGGRGLAGEVGHLRIAEDGPVCACGRTGCWEALVGLRALSEATGVPVGHDEDPVAYTQRLADTPGVEEALAPVAAALGRGVAHLGATPDPRMVVLGGSFVPLGPALVPAVEAALAQGFTGPGCTVALSTLGLHAASVGAAIDALDDVYAGRTSLDRPV